MDNRGGLCGMPRSSFSFDAKQYLDTNGGVYNARCRTLVAFAMVFGAYAPREVAATSLPLLPAR